MTAPGNFIWCKTPSHRMRAIAQTISSPWCIIAALALGLLSTTLFAAYVATRFPYWRHYPFSRVASVYTDSKSGGRWLFGVARGPGVCWVHSSSERFCKPDPLTGLTSLDEVADQPITSPPTWALVDFNTTNYSVTSYATGWPFPAFRLAQYYDKDWLITGGRGELRWDRVRGAHVIPTIPIFTGLIADAFVHGVFWILLVHLLRTGLVMRRQETRRKQGFCPECGYSLVSSCTNGICPECGTRTTPRSTED